MFPQVVRIQNRRLVYRTTCMLCHKVQNNVDINFKFNLKQIDPHETTHKVRAKRVFTRNGRYLKETKYFVQGHKEKCLYSISEINTAPLIMILRE